MADMLFDINESSFRLLAENPLMGITVASSEGRMLYVNQTFCKMLEYTSEEILSMHFFQLISPEDHENSFEMVEKLRRREIESFHMQKRAVTKTGKIIWCESNIVGKFNNDGQLDYLLALIYNIDVHKKAEHIIEESEAHFRSIAENSNDFIIRFDLKGMPLYMNPAAIAVFGVNGDQTGIHAYKESGLYNSKQRIPWEERIQWIAETGKVFSSQFAWERDKGLIYIDMRLIPEYNSCGKIVSILGISRDITDLKLYEIALKNQNEEYLVLNEELKENNQEYASLNEEYLASNEELKEKNNKIQLLYKKLEESEEKYRLAFRTSPDSININKLDGEYVDINEGFTRLTGYTRKDIIGVSSLKIGIWARPEDRDRLIRELTKYQRVENLESLFLCKDGSFKTALMSARIIKINNEPHILSITRDISERKLIEQALRDSEQRFSAAFNASPISIFISTLATGKYIDVNNTFLLEIGFSREEVIGHTNKDLGIFINPRDRDRLIESVVKNGSILGQECAFRTKSGKVLICLVSLTKIITNGEECLLATAMDITDRKKVEEELIKAKEKAEESDRLKSAFLANMSHEIRTPMNAIKGFAQLLQENDVPDHKKNKYAKIINQRTDDLLMLINDILDIAKIEAGQLNITEKPGNLNDLLNDIYLFFNVQKETSESREVLISYINELPSDSSFVIADFFRLRQILINLLNNALKFTSTGHVSFGCRLNDSENLLFYVEDTGVGIPIDKAKIIFEPFRQVNETYLSSKEGGTGLGLSIVKGLVELMKGRVWVESQVGVGSTFYFTLRYHQAKIIAEPKMNQFDTLFNWENKCILLVEDDEFNTELVVEILGSTKVQLFCAENGQKALEIINQHPEINLILMDIQLPDINGYQLTHKIKTIFPNVIVVAQTAYAAQGDKKLALESGCDDYVAKPINQNLLLQIIQKHFVSVRKSIR
jgi:PAS domain S-box-containing protein